MKFSYILKSLLPIALGFIVTSCEEVIDIDLNEADPRVVVEGRIVNGNGPHLIQLSESGAYFGESKYPTVKGATVTISDDLGNAELLIEQEDGMYYTQDLIGVPGRTYTLEIQIDEQFYEGSSTMPGAISVDSTLFYYDDGSSSFFADSGFYVMGGFLDSKELNYYRMHAFVGNAMEEVETPWQGVPAQDFELGAQLGVEQQI
ncbi:MAG: DUF4249 domain-containing protein, partial [Flavobacteriales bacterium]|nr:DUF4249 domain-containing protein [Flavobacteriales bacterium]